MGIYSRLRSNRIHAQDVAVRRLYKVLDFISGCAKLNIYCPKRTRVRLVEKQSQEFGVVAMTVNIFVHLLIMNNFLGNLNIALFFAYQTYCLEGEPCDKRQLQPI